MAEKGRNKSREAAAGVSEKPSRPQGPGIVASSDTLDLIQSDDEMQEVGYYIAHAKVAGALRHMRDVFKLSQRELGLLAGTSQAQVSKYEDPDYEGHKVGMLARLAGAVGWVFDPYFGPPGKQTTEAEGERASIRPNLLLTVPPEIGVALAKALITQLRERGVSLDEISEPEAISLVFSGEEKATPDS